MYDAYARIFTRMGLRFRAVDADTGAIGGSASHEFQVLADSGEDAIAFATAPTTRRTSSRPRRWRRRAARPAPAEPMQKVPTPGQATCEDVAELLGLPLARTVKCLLACDADGPPLHMLLVRGDHMRQRNQDRQAPRPRRMALGDRSGDRRRPPAASPATSGRSAFRRTMPLDRRPHRRRDGRLRLRRERGGLPPARRQLRPRLPRARPRGRHPQRRRGRPLARRQGHAGHRARHRGRPRLRAGRRVLRRRWVQLISTPPVNRGSCEMGCYGIGVTRVVAAAIEQNHDEQGHHLAAAAGAVRRGHRPDGLRPQRRRSRRSPTGCTTSSTAAGVECCSTTAASVLA